MSGFAVDPDELRRAAAALQALAAEHRSQPVTRYWMAPEESGDADLVDALTAFQATSDSVQRALPADLDETADRLTVAALRYAEVDAKLARQLRQHRQDDN